MILQLSSVSGDRYLVVHRLNQPPAAPKDCHIAWYKTEV